MKKEMILCLAAIFLLTLLAGCGSQEQPTEPAAATVPAGEPDEAALQTALDQVIARMQEEEAVDYLIAMESRSGWEVLAVEQTAEDRAEAAVRVYAPDLYSVVKALESETFTSEEEMDRAVTEGVEKAQILETELILEFYPDEGGVWTPALTGEFLDAYYGGLLTLRQEYLTAAGGA